MNPKKIYFSSSLFGDVSETRRLSLHQMWPDLIEKSKDGGANVIQTYVFWNGHEPVRGQVILTHLAESFEIKLLHCFLM